MTDARERLEARLSAYDRNVPGAPINGAWMAIPVRELRSFLAATASYQPLAGREEIAEWLYRRYWRNRSLMPTWKALDERHKRHWLADAARLLSLLSPGAPEGWREALLMVVGRELQELLNEFYPGRKQWPTHTTIISTLLMRLNEEAALTTPNQSDDDGGAG